MECGAGSLLHVATEDVVSGDGWAGGPIHIFRPGVTVVRSSSSIARRGERERNKSVIELQLLCAALVVW